MRLQLSAAAKDYAKDLQLNLHQGWPQISKVRSVTYQYVDYHIWVCGEDQSYPLMKHCCNYVSTSLALIELGNIYFLVKQQIVLKEKREVLV